jgi:HEAT repeat protein
MKSFWNLMTVLAVGWAVTFTGCSKPAEETPAAPSSTTTKKAAPPPKVTAPVTVPKTTAQAQPLASTGIVEMPVAEAAKIIAAVEKGYSELPDFSAKVGAIYKIAETGGAPAVEALGRLFQAEKDAELRVEIVDSLFDIDGQDNLKVALLSAAAAADQQQDVRESAIDALTDIDPKQALPILQALTSDPNEDIRDAAKDAVELVKAMAE